MEELARTVAAAFKILNPRRPGLVEESAHDQDAAPPGGRGLPDPRRERARRLANDAPGISRCLKPRS